MNTWLAESVSNWLPISTISVVPGQGFADVVNSSYVSWIRDIGLSHHGQVSPQIDDLNNNQVLLNRVVLNVTN